MKSGIHPDYHPLSSRTPPPARRFDSVDHHQFAHHRVGDAARSAHLSLVVVEITSDSHPFWTGSRRIVDTAGQVEKFHRRYGSRRQTNHRDDAAHSP